MDSRNAEEVDGRTVADHQFVRPDESTKIPSYLSSGTTASNLTGTFRYLPEDSSDSILSLDDQDDDDDDDSAEVSGKTSQASWPYQGSSSAGNQIL